MKQGDAMAAPKIRSLDPRLSPKLDVFLGGTDQVNQARAEQCPSVALAEPAVDGTGAAPVTRESEFRETIEVEAAGPVDAASPRAPTALSPAEVIALAAKTPQEAPPENVVFSLFVKLDRDLTPNVREDAINAVNRYAKRSRWKLDTGVVEVAAKDVRDLLVNAAVAYVEPGQALRGPEPVIGHNITNGPGDTRRVKAESARHHDGQDVLVGIIDVGGFDFAHPDFLDKSKTRWVAIWDQAGTSRPSPANRNLGRYVGLDYGSEIRGEHMNAAIDGARTRNMAASSLEPQSQMVIGSHGTHVASIAAGNDGVARNAFIAGVLLALRPEDTVASSSFYDSTRIADAVEYLIELAAELGKDNTPLPLSINISLGTNGHAHDTSSAMARWIDNALATRGRCVSVAAGNAGQVEPGSPTDRGYVKGRIHASGKIPATNLRRELGWIVGGDGVQDISENELEIWYGPQDRFDVEVKPPGQPWLEPIRLGQMIRNALLGNGTVLSVYNEAYHPANGLNRISVLLSPFFGPQQPGGSPQLGPIASGEWRVRLTGAVVRDGSFDAWIERDDPRRVPGSAQQWRYPSYFAPGSYTDDRMIGSLACAERLLSVANADIDRNAAHVTSSRGPTRDGRPKPDIAANGTAVVAAKGFDSEVPWIEMTGTSMASPFVCGVAALMLGIKSDLTSAQIQGILRSTSSPLPGQTFGWRNDTGFGLIDATACVRATAKFTDMVVRSTAATESGGTQ
ncbi:peptidase S8 and S53 subtilisin kexin sedolisin [Kribbella pittospori]|uniref:Peptidase S8 and S53 subtilisin kexin sedolisin n=2 Tax=Kribbella pittospori TaxID=722689 RepID=A0A4R0KSC6_9ACTN|nr:peptidase S8 and S53 subtilisin kexin sedolisin [Kribbella pittospori]